MARLHRHLPPSAPNMILVGSFTVVAVVCGVFQSWVACAITLALAIALTLLARLARRSESSDLVRLNALEYRDERDRALARSGFSVVGAVALIITLAEWIVAAAEHLANPAADWATGIYYLAWMQMLLFNFIWTRANRAATQEN